MEKYVIPRKKRRHLVVEESVHDAVHFYALQQGISMVEATFRLLKLGLAQTVNLPISKNKIDKYRLAETAAEKLRRWFHRDQDYGSPVS
jgi:hypothetical protein